MRSFKTTYITVFLLTFFVYCTGLANSPRSIVAQFQGESIILSSQEKFTTPLQVRLIDLDGKVLLSENLELSAFTKNYNLKELPNGTYNLEISNKEEILTKTLIIDQRIISLVKEETVYKPHFFIKGKVCTISLLSFGKKATVIVENEFGEELFTETFKDQESISRKYDFSIARIGDYSVHVLYDGHVYTHQMNIFI